MQTSSWDFVEVIIRTVIQQIDQSIDGFVICWHCWKVVENKRCLVAGGSGFLVRCPGRLYLVSSCLLSLSLLHSPTPFLFLDYQMSNLLYHMLLLPLPWSPEFALGSNNESIWQMKPLKLWTKPNLSYQLLSQSFHHSNRIYLINAEYMKERQLSLVAHCTARTSTMSMAVVSSYLVWHGGT